MAKNYQMCGLAQDNSRTTGWIETRGAKPGARVEIPELGGFWTVIGVGTTVFTADQLTAKQNANRNSCTSIK